MSTKTWYVGKTGNHQGLVIEEETGRSVAVAYDKQDAPMLAAGPRMADALAKVAAFLESWAKSPACTAINRDRAMAQEAQFVRAALQKAGVAP
jgi:hypothetical protein